MFVANFAVAAAVLAMDNEFFWLCTQKIESEEDNQGASNQQQAC
jgi:hypothetical protein